MTTTPHILNYLILHELLVAYVKEHYASSYEKITENGVTKEIVYLPGGAIHVKQDNINTIYYTHTEHLGSIIKITTSTGTPVFSASYDAWGIRTVTNNTFKFHRGYTGHEHLVEFGLINMNGRVYDPMMGRFLSPDPYVQSPLFSQSFNRYSYCWNNPMCFTDPSGEWLDLALFIVGMGLMQAYVKGSEGGSWDWKEAGKGFFHGALLAGTMVGSFYLPTLFPVGLGSLSGLINAAGQFALTALNTASYNWIINDNFKPNWSAAGLSAIPGLIQAGVGGFSAVKHNGNFFTGKGATFVTYIDSDGLVKVGKNMEYSTEYAKSFSDENFGKIKKLDNLYSDGRVPSKEFKIKGDLVFYKGRNAGGATIYNGFGKGSNVYLFKSSFTSMEQLYLTMGHEYIHVYFNAHGFSKNIAPQEKAAYKWNIDQARAWKIDYTFYQNIYNKYYNKTMYPVLKYEQAGFFILNLRPW